MDTPSRPWPGPSPQQAPPRQAGPYAPGRVPQANPNGQATIELQARWSKLTFIYAMCTPVVTLNGYRVPARWGRNVYPVQPGQHQVDVHVNYFGFPMGRASLAGPVQPSGSVQLEYWPPSIVYLRGALGAPPQKAPGKTLGLILGVVVPVAVLVVVAVMVGIAVSGSG